MFKNYRLYKKKVHEKKRLLQNFKRDFEKYNLLANPDQIAQKEFLYPCLYDNTELTNIEPVYFYQDAWAFERILLEKPINHIDVGSNNKFVAFLSKITNLSMVDLRPLSLAMSSIKFIKGDILNLPFENESIDSLSSLCVIEHIGLGRYGDDLDPNGSEKAFKEITRVMKKGGHLYVSVPVSNRNIIHFNAGRIFDVETLLESIKKQYSIKDKKFIFQSNLQNEFSPHDKFGTTILLDLIKN